MNRLILLLSLLLLPVGAFSIETAPQLPAGQSFEPSLQGAALRGEKMPIHAKLQMSSFNKPAKSPCRCKANVGSGCSVSASTGLNSTSNSFDPPRKCSFSSLFDVALTGNSHPVPLPPPRV